MEYYRSDGALYEAYYRLIGPWTSVTVFDQGFRRTWAQSVTWDPAPPVVPGQVGVIATVIDGTGNRVASNRDAVHVVPWSIS